MRHSLLLHAAYGVLAWVGTLVVAPYIVPLALGPGFEPSVELLRNLAPLMPLAAISQFIGGNVLIPMRRDLMVTLITAAGAIALLAGIFAFTPAGGAAATAHVRVISQGLIAALMVWAVLRDGTLQRILGHRTP
jgi:O-antigen/teichoic acid export membrane protein